MTCPEDIYLDQLRLASYRFHRCFERLDLKCKKEIIFGISRPKNCILRIIAKLLLMMKAWATNIMCRKMNHRETSMLSQTEL